MTAPKEDFSGAIGKEEEEQGAAAATTGTDGVPLDANAPIEVGMQLAKEEAAGRGMARPAFRPLRLGNAPSPVDFPVDMPPRPRICIGASLFLFSIEPTYGVPVVLMAREKKQRWLGRSNYTYTDFGGGASAGESRAEQVASREFVEESLGAVRYFDSLTLDQLPDLQRNVAAGLSAGTYLARIETPVCSGKMYVTYVKQVPYQPGVCGAFRRAKDLLFRARYELETLSDEERAFVSVHPGLQRNGDTGQVTIDRCYLEKQSLEYFSLQGLEYWMATGTHNLVPGFSCQPYFKGRLRVALTYLRGRFTTLRRLRSERRTNFVPLRTKPSYNHFPHQQQRQFERFVPLHNELIDHHDNVAGEQCGWHWGGAGSGNSNSADQREQRRWPRRIGTGDQPSDVDNCRSLERSLRSHSAADVRGGVPAAGHVHGPRRGVSEDRGGHFRRSGGHDKWKPRRLRKRRDADGWRKQ
jgi:hypothetical protein